MPLFGTALVLLLAMIMTINALVPLFGKLIVYHAAYVVDEPARPRIMLAAMIAGQFAGIVPWTQLARLRSARFALASSMAVVALASAASAARALVAGVSAAGDAAVALAFGFGACGIYMLIWLFVSQAADDVEHASGVATTTFVFALAIVAIKEGQGAGAALAGALLDRPEHASGAGSDPDIGSIITAIQSVAPLVGTGVAAVFLVLLGRQKEPAKGS